MNNDPIVRWRLMPKKIACVLLACMLIAVLPAMAPAAQNPQELYDRVAPSLVAVKYTWETELERHELIGAGVVITKEGVVMAPLALFGMIVPDDQMKDFKIVVPHQDKEHDELDAILLGRDERSNLAFLKTKESQDWKPIKFEEAPPKIGDVVYSVGLLPEVAAYKPYFMQSQVSALLRGESPQVLTSSGLAALGSPVFDGEGKAIGLVPMQANQSPMLNVNDRRFTLNSILNPPRFFVPSRDFLSALSDLPSPESPAVLPWIGVPAMTGLNKDVAEVFGLENQPAVQIGDVIPKTPAEEAGLKRGDIVVKLNGEPLQRGDEPEEIPMMLRRQLVRMKPGDEITLSVKRGKDEPLQDIKVKLGEMPQRANKAKRFFADDLGFSVRELVFDDTYVRKLPQDAPGVLVAIMRPQSAAQTGGLHVGDLVTDLNGKAVKDLEQFKTAYQQFRKDKPKDAVVMVALREGQTQTIRMEPPQ